MADRVRQAVSQATRATRTLSELGNPTGAISPRLQNALEVIAYRPANASSDVANEVRHALATLPDVSLELIGLSEPSVVLRFTGPDLPSLYRVADLAAQTLGKLPGTVDVQVWPPREQKRQATIEIDASALARTGVLRGTVQDYVDCMGAGRTVAPAGEGKDSREVRVMFGPGEIRVPTVEGGLVPLASLIRQEVRAGPESIERENGLPAVRVRVRLSVNPDGYAKLAQAELTRSLQLPAGAVLTWE